MACAFHEPQRLTAERRRAIDDAADHHVAEKEITDVRAMLERLERSGAMCDSPDEIEAHKLRYGKVS